MQEYKAQRNIKLKLDTEISTNCHLLEDGEDFNLYDAQELQLCKPTKRSSPIMVETLCQFEN